MRQSRPRCQGNHTPTNRTKERRKAKEGIREIERDWQAQFSRYCWGLRWRENCCVRPKRWMSQNRIEKVVNKCKANSKPSDPGCPGLTWRCMRGVWMWHRSPRAQTGMPTWPVARAIKSERNGFTKQRKPRSTLRVSVRQPGYDQVLVGLIASMGSGRHVPVYLWYLRVLGETESVRLKAVSYVETLRTCDGERKAIYCN